MATSDGTTEGVSVASTATARVVEIDGSDTRHRSKRKLYRSETKRGADEVSGESFQVILFISKLHTTILAIKILCYCHDYYTPG